MALPSSGQITLNQVNVELGNSGTAEISMGSAAVRGLFGIASGEIEMSDGYGKSNTFTLTISSNTTNANLRTLAVNAGWDESTEAEITIGSGVYVYATSTGNDALLINGSWPNGVTLINNGFIAGRGGNGGAGKRVNDFPNQGTSGGSVGTSAGRALNVGSPVSINNQGTIGGGGGGGGGGGAGVDASYSPDRLWWGGGGGGGRSNGSGGAGGAGSWGYGNAPDGANGSLSAAGAGGAGSGQQGDPATGSKGGDGGNYGASGGSGSYTGAFAGGAGGAAISGNSNITWIANGTKLGSIS